MGIGYQVQPAEITPSNKGGSGLYQEIALSRSWPLKGLS